MAHVVHLLRFSGSEDTMVCVMWRTHVQKAAEHCDVWLHDVLDAVVAVAVAAVE